VHVGKSRPWPPLAAMTVEALARRGEGQLDEELLITRKDSNSSSVTSYKQPEAAFVANYRQLEAASAAEEPSEASTVKQTLFEQDTGLMVQSTVRVYETLQNDDSIRLMEMCPGQQDDPIFCRLHQTRLHASRLAYEALSYAWGESSDDFVINLNLRPMRIRKNLFHALRRVRLPDRSRIIWVDALCIDQGNLVERSRQVQLMGSIYKMARNVLIWVGEAPHSRVASAFAVLCSVVNDWQRDVDGAEHAAYSITRPNRAATVIEYPPPPDSDIWGCVSALFDCSWFWRLWVVQEAVLARSASLMWGQGEIPWRWVGLAAAIIRTNYYQVLRSFKMAGIYNAYLMYRVSPASHFAHPFRPVSFLQMLRLTRQFESTDPRDRIYGLLGMPMLDNNPETGALFIQPDYSLSVDEVFQRVGDGVMAQSGLLELLSSVQYQEGARQCDHSDSFPSWIPRWDLVFTSTLAPWDPGDNFAAAKGFPLQRKQSTFPSRLIIKGLEVATIIERSDLISRWQDLTVLLRTRCKACLQTESGLVLVSKTLTAGRTWYGSLAQGGTACLSDFCAFLIRILKIFDELIDEQWLRDTAQSGDAGRFLEAAMSACNGRRLFSTSKGFWGLGPSSMAEGDFIYILSGGDLPFILRPKEDHFRLVGECYVDNLMNGEAVEKAVPSQFRIGNFANEQLLVGTWLDIR
jgi:hypothetical protein